MGARGNFLLFAPSKGAYRQTAGSSGIHHNNGRRYQAMTKMRRVRAVLGINKHNIPAVLTRAQAMHNGLDADKVTYAGANPALPTFLTYIVNLTTAQQAVVTRVKGAAAARDVQRDILFTAMDTERIFVQGLADASPGHALALIQNAGLLVAQVTAHSKPILKLALGKQPGSVDCDANVGLLIGAGTAKPRQSKFFNWSYTLDGGKSFLTAPSTPTGKTTLFNLPLLTQVGVRINLNNMSGPGEWSQVVYILVH
jgi:hypothetical protein